MEFDWTPAKCAKNIAERGIDFADVAVGFADPMKKVARDDRKDYGEERFNMLAMVEGRVFHVHLYHAGSDHVDNLRPKSKQTEAAAL
jgi:uncharacterized DUF497 family protein